MSYHASGRPTFRTGSVVVVPADVRASERYGADVSATKYARTDANGMSVGIVRDVLRGERTRSHGARTKVIRTVPSAHAAALARAARERAIAGTIGNVE